MTLRRIGLLLALSGIALTQPSARPSSTPERDTDADAKGAMEWRLMTLRGPDGRVAPDGLSRAWQHMQRMKTAQRASVAAMALSQTSWRWLGPGNIGGRVRSIAISPTNPDTAFAGSVAGGIWRSTDGGESWRPVDDFMANLAISSIVINPANSNEMYAGTGEVYYNYDALHGAGIFKSSDGGTSWSQLPATATDPAFLLGVARLAFSPDGKVLLAAAGGYVFRSTDAGNTFTKSASVGLIDLNFDPNNAANACGVGFSGLGYYTRDGGVTWQRSANVPSVSPPGRLEVTYAPSQPNLVYLGTNTGTLYVSIDGGASYTVRNSNPLGFAQGWYNLTVWVNPKDANHLLYGGEQLYESTNGGSSWRDVTGSMHVDQHVIVEDPQFDNSIDRGIWVGNDGGVYRADAIAGGTYAWSRRDGDLGVTQFYGAAGSASSGRIVGGTQDNGTLLYRPEAGTIWSPVVDGDGGFVASDPTNPNLFYGETQYLGLTRSPDGGANWYGIYYGLKDAQTSNANFIAPFILDPNNPARMLAGGLYLWKSENLSANPPTWTTISPGFGHLSAIAVAQGQSDIIWIGNSGGYVYRTTNGTSASPTWTQMFATAGGTFITRITIDPLDSNVVYICTGGFTKGAIQRSEDGGATWMDATGTGDTGLPAVPVRDVEVDPSDPFTIYAGTEVGLFVSHDRGGTWQLPTDGPANVSVDELFFMGTTLVAATHGRGIFAADLNQQSGESIAMTPDHVDFGSQPVNTQSTSQSVVVSNTGSVSVTVQAVQVTSGYTDSFYFSSNNCNDVTLPPGGSCEFSVYVFARQTGAIDAVVSVASTVPGSPRRVALTATGIPQGVQAPWVQRDIGAVGYPGSASYANGLFTISGAGADIWGAADAFHFVYQPFSGDGTIVARVASFVTQDANAWAKTGVMMRATTDPASPHVSVYVTPGRGIALQWRSTAGGTTTNVAVAGAAPTFVRLGRSGGSITASYSSDGSAWTPLGTVSVTLPQSMLAGMPITSHDDPYTATARLDNVVVTAAAATLPPPWTQNDIGAVAIGGSAALSNGTFTIKGSGADIWGTADAFHYLHQPFSGDGWISARVDTVQNVNAWAKAGVMIRASTDPGAPHVSVYVTPGKGIALQWRSTAGGATSNMQANGAAPRYVRIGRSGDTLFTAAYSSDGTTWTTVGTVTVNLPESVLAGLAISSHDNTQAATSTIDQVSVRPALSAPWTQQDIGATGPAGHADNTNGTFTIEGSGADIWGTADAFHYVYQPLSGDTDIQAHVASVQNVNVWTKAGLMVRASTDAGAAQVSVFVTPGKGIAMQWRASTGGASSSISVAGAAPVFIRLTRSGNNITAWYANDGSSWTAIGTATVVMSSDVFVGLAVTSHDNTQTATAVFDNVTFFSP